MLDDTAIIISADHGECLGELNTHADHRIADQCWSRLPLIVRWPGVTTQPRVDRALHYHLDLAPTVLELAEGRAPANWDAVSYAKALRRGGKGRARVPRHRRR